MSLGQYPDVSLAKAREDHAAARGLLAGGSDPMALRKAERAALKSDETRSFRSIAYLWLEHWQVDKSARHAGTTRRRVESNIFPFIGARPIYEIKVPELLAMAKSIEARGVGDLAKRTLQTTGQIFRYAIAHGYAERNPCTDFQPADALKPHKKVNMARVDSKELPSYCVQLRFTAARS